MLDSIDIKDIIDISHQAGHEIKKIYTSKVYHIKTKEDNSPVTQADIIANDIIIKGLTKYNINFISEEIINLSFNERKYWEYAFVIDPLDGTKQFINGCDDFSVNIGLIKNGKPVLGVVYMPITNTTYYAKSGEGAYCIYKGLTNKLPFYKDKKSKLKVACSNIFVDSETQNYIDSLGDYDIVKMGSSLKLCKVATGEIDIYPRLKSIMEWDICACHAILNEAGKKILQYGSDKEVVYNKKDLNSGKFIAK